MSEENFGIGERGIEFRAWNAKHKTWSSPLNIYVNGGGEIIYVLGGMVEEEFSKGEIMLMKYTGFKDKNGKKIFEGDVVKKSRGVGYSSKCYASFADGTQRESIFVARWDETRCGYPDLSEPNDSNFCQEIEIIGNIFENPELLNN